MNRIAKAVQKRFVGPASRRCKLFLAAWLAASWTACADNGEPASPEVVLHIEDAPLWTTDLHFEVEQHEDDPLGRVAGAVFAAAGLVAIGDGLNNRVVLADSSGSLVGTVGRAGMGPLEFVQLGLVARWPAGDSVFAWDARARRYSVFSPDTRQGRTTLPEGMETPVGRALPGPDGGLWIVGLVLAGPGDMPASGRHRLRHDVGYWGGLGDMQKIGSIAGMQFAGQWPVLFAPHTSLATGSGLLFVSEGERPIVAAMDASGAVRREITVNGLAAEFTEALREKHVEWLKENGGHTPEAVDRMLENAPLPPIVDAFVQIVFAQEGSLWLGQRGVPGGEERHWINVTTEGAPIRRILMPAGRTMLDAAGDRLLFLRRDYLQRDYVEVHTAVSPG